MIQRLVFQELFSLEEEGSASLPNVGTGLPLTQCHILQDLNSDYATVKNSELARILWFIYTTDGELCQLKFKMALYRRAIF